MKKHIISIVAGVVGGFAGNGILGALFSSGPIKTMLYDPTIQSQLFIDITQRRNIPLSVGGLVVLSSIHGILYGTLRLCLPGRSWIRKGISWGVIIWLMYWVFQEWFVYHTLLGEPILLNLFELAILLAGSIVEGVIIAGIIEKYLPSEIGVFAARKEWEEGRP